MPFCIPMTRVCGPISVSICGSTGRIWCALSATITQSTAPTDAMSSVAATCAEKSPRSDFTSTPPRSRIAARCGPRAISVTSAPPRASDAPTYAPIAPAPTTA